MKKIVTYEPEVGDMVRVEKRVFKNYNGHFYGVGAVTSVPYGGYPETRYGIKINDRTEYLCDWQFTLLGEGR